MKGVRWLPPSNSLFFMSVTSPEALFGGAETRRTLWVANAPPQNPSHRRQDYR
jgi:hypothetical protein